MDRPLLTVVLAMGSFLAEIPPPSLTEFISIGALLVVGLGWTSTSEDQLVLLGRAYAPVQFLHLYNGPQHPYNCGAPKVDFCERAAWWVSSSLVEMTMASVALS